MEIQINKETSKTFLANLFRFSGRAARKEYWLYTLGIALVQFALFAVGFLFVAISEWLIILTLPLWLAAFALILALIATLFRRLHDLGLSGFWVCYLLPMIGLPALVFAYLLGADDSAKNVIERIKGIGTPWLSWIVVIFCWINGSWFGNILIAVAPGQKGENLYGPDPLA